MSVPFFELFLELFDLGPDDGPAIALVRIASIEVLMVRFGFVKLLQRHNLSHDRVAEMLLCLGLGFFRSALLRFIVVENNRAVLRPRVGALAVQRGWVMRLPKCLQYL